MATIVEMDEVTHSKLTDVKLCGSAELETYVTEVMAAMTGLYLPVM